MGHRHLNQVGSLGLSGKRAAKADDIDIFSDDDGDDDEHDPSDKPVVVMAKAFLQLTMDPADVLDMGFVDPFSGEVLCFRAPMFGLAAAPRFLHLAVQTSVRAIATVLRALAIRLHDTD